MAAWQPCMSSAGPYLHFHLKWRSTATHTFSTFVDVPSREGQLHHQNASASLQTPTMFTLNLRGHKEHACAGRARPRMNFFHGLINWASQYILLGAAARFIVLCEHHQRSRIQQKQAESLVHAG